MHVAKWGNSLAVRLPAAVVEALGLKAGDEIEIRVAGPRTFEVAPDASRERALAKVGALARDLPPGWRLDRDEASARTTLSSEDMQDGLLVDGRLRIQDPFKPAD